MENVSKFQPGKAVYTCPTCGERMERDLLLFINHTDAHVVNELKKKHPEWITNEGFCPQCLAHYKAAMRGEATVVNIAGREVKKRQLTAVFSFAFLILLFFLLARSGTPRIYRLFLGLSFFAASVSFFQVKKNHCVVLGMKGVRNMDHGEEPVKDPAERTRLRHESQQILIFSLILAAALTAFCFYLF